MRRLSPFISVHSELVLSFIIHDMLVSPKEKENLPFIPGIGTKPKLCDAACKWRGEGERGRLHWGAERKPPCCSRTRPGAGEMPQLLKSAAKSSTGGGSDRCESGDVQETSTVNTMRAGARP